MCCLSFAKYLQVIQFSGSLSRDSSGVSEIDNPITGIK